MQKVLITYQDKTQSIAEWAREYQLDPQLVYGRIKKGWDIENALTTPVRPHQSMLEYQGRTQSVSDWAQELGIKVSTLGLRIRSGWTLEQAFTPPPPPRLLEYNGKRQTVNAWAKELGLPQSALNARILRGWSVAEALGTPANGKPRKAEMLILEHDGKSQSVADWATELNVATGTIERRIKQGWNIEKILKRAGRQIEYDGRTQSITQWGRELGMSPALIRSRLNRGWTPAEALTHPKIILKPNSRDHFRKRRNWRLNNVTEQNPQTPLNLRALEYDGRVQPLAAWARELGFCPSVLRGRLKNGWTVKEAFEIPKGKHCKTIDPDLEYNGRMQPLSAWARELGVKKDLIRDRLKRGWTVTHALELRKGKHPRAAKR